MAAVLLSIELLLFEYRARSIIPVALSAASAMAVRKLLISGAPAFPMPAVVEPGWSALAAYVVLGAIIGVAAVAITRFTYAVEDAFERLPVNWMWWPAIGAGVGGVVAYA
jgi:H+/Cl- antiporter ClcA